MLDDFVVEVVVAAVALDESLQVQLCTSSVPYARTGCTADYRPRGSVHRTPGYRDEAGRGRDIDGERGS